MAHHHYHYSAVTGSGGAAAGGTVSAGGGGGDLQFSVTNIVVESSAVQLLSLRRAHDAAYDSGRQDLQSCLQGTRVDVLNNIMSWLERVDDNTPPIYWLNGVVGSGKSTIAKTISEQAEEKDILRASFFFSRSDESLRNPRLVFPTLALQLAQSDDACKAAIVEAINRDTTIGDKVLSTQIQRLIVTPLHHIRRNGKNVLIVLDALDECEERGAAEILKLLFSPGNQIPYLRILITSRPESHISSVFDDFPIHNRMILHDIQASIIDRDIRFYIKSKLAEISRAFGLTPSAMGADWVTEDEINSLVTKSGGLFVYAAITIRFIGDDRLQNPRRQLKLVLDAEAAQQAEAKPYAPLASLYMGVLQNTLSPLNPRDVLNRFQVVVGSIVVLRQPLPLASLAQFVGYRIDLVAATLSRLGSVIILPSGDHEAPRIYHHSFLDFIQDPNLCSDPHFVIVAVPDQERRHAIRCFALMAASLRRDMAGILDPWLLNSEVDGLEGKVINALPPEVQYACKFWASHLLHVEPGNREVVNALEGFSRQSILFWLEAMSLMDSSFTAAGCIQKARHWAVASKCEPTLVMMLSDAYRFIRIHTQGIRDSALHVYYSALAFTPHDTAFYKTYCHENNHSIRVLQGLESQWPQSLAILLGHSGPVHSVAFSLDGLWLASGSDDHSIRLWDATSGRPIMALEGHSDAVLSVAFSWDGLQLASGSKDYTVCLWNTTSGKLTASLKGHSHWVNSVAFSLNGLLASGSNDHSVQLWDAVSNRPSISLQGHSDSVRSIVFSRDGACLASGSDDHCIRLWDPKSGNTIASLKSLSGPVHCLAFSPDGKKLASGSHGNLVQLWDAILCKPIAPLKGHSGLVTSTAFSLDGWQLASGSHDHSIRLWDAKSGKPIVSLKGHSSRVGSVTFSPDGLWVASASDDCSIRLWDATLGKPTAPPQQLSHQRRFMTSLLHPLQQPSGTPRHSGQMWSNALGDLSTPLKIHSTLVDSITLSPDGSRVVSVLGYSVWLWDAMSGQHIASLKGHSHKLPHNSHWLVSVTFSPDGVWLALHSLDHSIQLWDPMSGKLIASLKGHTNSVNCATFSPDGVQLASGSNDHSIRLWHASSGKLIASLKGHSGPVNCVVFSPNQPWLASGADDHSIRLWNTISGRLIVSLNGHADWVRAITFSPDGSCLASGSDDHSIKLWKPPLDKPIASLDGHSRSITSIAFSPDASKVASGSKDLFVWLWDANSGKQIASLEGHSAEVISVKYPTDHTLVSQSAYETLVWNLTVKPPLSVVPETHAVAPPSTAPHPLIWSHHDNWLQLWHLPENHNRHICWIPHIYPPGNNIQVTRLPTQSQIALACKDGRIIILHIQHDPFGI